MERDELLRMPSYWMAKVQNELYRQVDEYMRLKNMDRRQMAEYLGCSQREVAHLLKGESDLKLSKLIEVSLAMGKIPCVTFDDVEII